MNAESISEAATVIKEGGLVVFPTDTVYGLGCDPFSGAAVERLVSAKKRYSKPIPVLCSSFENARELVMLSPKAVELAKKYWPGPLTIVAPLNREMPQLLTRGSPNLGVRVPGLKDCLDLTLACGGWLAGTSANLSGLPSSRTPAEAAEQLGSFVDLVLDGGSLAGKESTVVQVVGDTVTILRTGPIGVGPK